MGRHLPGGLTLRAPPLTVQPHISLITLAVDDLDRAIRFYRDGLGLATPGIVGQEFALGSVAFFELQGGLKLAVWPRTSMAADTGLGLSRPGPPACTIGHNVRTRIEVDQVIEQARAAGAEIVREPAPVFWGGYAGYFRDPDGHVWEVACNESVVGDP
jgi:catechol 2,3-dioxygenase-like lactoylglutathione lyase family enzyme